MSRVFLDTVGLLALWDESDQWHHRAAQAFEQILARREKLVTTTHVLLECGNASSRRPYREAPAILFEQLDEVGGLVHPTTDDLRESWKAYRRHNAGGAGIVDQVSFTVMKRLGISRAFTNDRHFAAAGFEILF